MKKAMLFAAGLGTRLKPLTDHRPKALVEVEGRPLLDITLRRLTDAGFRQVVINIHHFASMIREYLSQHDYGIDIRLSDESDKLLDTGGGLRKAAELFTPDDDPILIHNVDILSNAPLADFYEACRPQMAGLLVSSRDSSRQLLFNERKELCGWQNMATGAIKSPYSDFDATQMTHYAFSGIHCISPKLLSRMKDWPEKFSIIDFYLSACRDVSIIAHPMPSLRLLDVGKQDTLQAASNFLKKN